jgi:hypothetical protein
VTLPASFPLSMSQVLAELQLATPSRAYPISLHDTDVRTLAGVPSGAISMSNLLGKSVTGTLSVANIQQAEHAVINPSDANASITLFPDGTGDSTSFGTYDWVTGGPPPTVHVRCTVTSGSLSGGSGTGTWLSVGAGGVTRSWARNRTLNGTSVAVITLDFSLNGGSSIAATVSGLTLTATVEI